MQVPVILPALVGRGEDRLLTPGPGIVDQDVGAAEGGLDRVGKGTDPAGVTDISCHPDRLNAELFAELMGNLAHPLLIAHTERQMDTLGREPAGDGQPDANTSSCDGSYFVLQVKVHGV